MEIRTRHWGVLQIADDRILAFPEGLPGFPHCRRFALLGEAGGAFLWLQSVDDPEVALPVTDPFALFTGYEVPLDENDVAVLRIADPQDVAVFVVVAVRADPLEASANLAAPLLINTAARTGRQKVLDGSPYGVRHPLLPSR